MMTTGTKGMQAAMRGILLSGLAVLTSSPAVAHPGAHPASGRAAMPETSAPATSATPVGTVTAFHAALAAGDTVAALALLAEDVAIFESGNIEASRDEYAGHHLAADAAFSAAVPRTLVRRTVDEAGNIAWVTSVETLSGTYRDRAINSRSVETMVLRRSDGAWRIVHIHWSSADLRPIP